MEKATAALASGPVEPAATAGGHLASQAAEQRTLAESRETGMPSATAVPLPAASTSRAPNSTGAEKLVSETRPQAANVSGEVEAATTSLSEDLDNLRIRPEESDQMGSKPQDDDHDDEDADYVSLLSKMRQVLSLGGYEPKKVLQPILETFDLEGIASFIKKGKAQRIVFMCGAGISVSAGIPDFRSPKTGLYHNLQKYNLPHPQAVFELDYFRRKPEPFYQLAKELFPGNFKPTPAHYFMTLVHKKGLLLRCFTQNIDSLERQAGLPPDRIIAAHGNFDTARCIKCRKEVSLEALRKAVDEERPCRCPKCGGLVKPDIVFFGESLPEAFFQHAEQDFPEADLLIVMGTSLVVNPFASLIDHVEEGVPRVLINRERVGEADATLMLLGAKRGFQFDEGHRDAIFLGECDQGVRELARHLGWEAELDELIMSQELGPKQVAQSDL